MKRNTLYAVGHGSRSIYELFELLRAAGVEVVVDVRSQPWSRWHPQYNREPLSEELERAGYHYQWAPALGGRPEDDKLYTRDGRVDYRAVSETTTFKQALTELCDQATQQRVAIMCSETNPENCHRRLLIGRVLLETGTWKIRHLGAPGWDTEDEPATGQLGLFDEWVSAAPIRQTET